VTEVQGCVVEVPPAQRRVLVAVESDLSGYVVDERTTVSIPLTDVKEVVPAP
jgi:hypothetical protein